MKQSEKSNIFIEIIGWYGTAAIVLGYFLLSFDFIQANSLIYQALNLTGALGIVGVSLHKRTYQPAVLNIIWSVVAVAALLNSALR